VINEAEATIIGCIVASVFLNIHIILLMMGWYIWIFGVSVKFFLKVQSGQGLIRGFKRCSFLIKGVSFIWYFACCIGWNESWESYKL